MTNSFEIVVTILQTIEEYKKGNINRTTLELIIKGAINLVEENNRYDFSKNCGCGKCPPVYQVLLQVVPKVKTKIILIIKTNKNEKPKSSKSKLRYN